jgi:hypothetical protein
VEKESEFVPSHHEASKCLNTAMKWHERQEECDKSSAASINRPERFGGKEMSHHRKTKISDGLILAPLV